MQAVQQNLPIGRSFPSNFYGLYRIHSYTGAFKLLERIIQIFEVCFCNLYTN